MRTLTLADDMLAVLGILLHHRPPQHICHSIIPSDEHHKYGDPREPHALRSRETDISSQPWVSTSPVSSSR